MPIKSKVTGTGSALPPYEVDNDMLMPIIAHLHPEAKPRKWCEQVFGVYRRRRSFDYDKGALRPGCTDGELSFAASIKALRSADLTIDDIDYIVYATGSPEHIIDPDPVVELHRRLGGKEQCGGITVPITCTGLVDAVVIADALIKAGTITNALLVATSVPSSYPTQSWEFMFNAGDAAAALILSATNGSDPSGVIDTFFQLHPSEPAVRVRHCGTAQFWMADEGVRTGLDLEMYLEQIVLEGLTVVDSLLHLIVGRHPTIMQEIDWLVCHQASGLLQHHLALMTGLPLRKIPFHVDQLGNTMTASTGVAIDKLHTDGALNKGDLVLVIAAGTSWRTAAYLMRW